MHRVSRRNFILTGSVGAGALLAAMGNARTSPVNGLASTGTLVVSRRDGTMNEMVNQCVDALGGIEKFVPAGSKVAIKVVCLHPDIHKITNPEMVKQVVRMVRTADPEEITVYEHPPAAGGAAWPIIAKAVRSGGAEPILLRHDPEDFVPVSFPGVSVKSNLVAKALDEADVLINLPYLHASGGRGIAGSVGLKNHMGSILYRGYGTEGDLPTPNIGQTPHGCLAGLAQGVADINTIPAIRAKHRLTIVDAIHPSGTHTYMPQNDYNGIIAGTDPVATDYAAMEVMGRYFKVNPSDSLGRCAAALGLGTNDPARIVFDERSVSTPIPEIQLPMAVAGIAGLGMMALARRSRKGQENWMPNEPENGGDHEEGR